MIAIKIIDRDMIAKQISSMQTSWLKFKTISPAFVELIFKNHSS
jgi:hypothetical protein